MEPAERRRMAALRSSRRREPRPLTAGCLQYRVFPGKIAVRMQHKGHYRTLGKGANQRVKVGRNQGLPILGGITLDHASNGPGDGSASVGSV